MWATGPRASRSLLPELTFIVENRAVVDVVAANAQRLEHRQPRRVGPQEAQQRHCRAVAGRQSAGEEEAQQASEFKKNVDMCATNSL